jgi:hypothetical protein
MSELEVKKYKSLKSVPIRVEMSEVKHDSKNVLTVEHLAVQIEEARKGKARVDSKYVNYNNEAGHLFDYKFDYSKFLENMSHIIKKAKSRPPEERYKNSHETKISADSCSMELTEVHKK